MERKPVLGEFGDRRLEEGGTFLLERLCTVGQSGVCIRTLGDRAREGGGDRAGELRITRFLRNEQVTPEEMFATAGAHTASLVQGCHILAIQDTTPLRDRACPRTLDPGGKKNSLQLHPTIAVDAQTGALYGLVAAELLPRRGGKKARRKKRPFAKKESRPSGQAQGQAMADQRRGGRHPGDGGRRLRHRGGRPGRRHL